MRTHAEITEWRRRAESCTLATYLAAPRVNQQTIDPHQTFLVEAKETDAAIATMDELVSALERLDKVAVDLGRAPGYDMITWIRNLVLERTQLRARVACMRDGHGPGPETHGVQQP